MFAFIWQLALFCLVSWAHNCDCLHWFPSACITLITVAVLSISLCWFIPLLWCYPESWCDWIRSFVNSFGRLHCWSKVPVKRQYGTHHTHHECVCVLVTVHTHTLIMCEYVHHRICGIYSCCVVEYVTMSYSLELWMRTHFPVTVVLMAPKWIIFTRYSIVSLFPVIFIISCVCLPVVAITLHAWVITSVCFFFFCPEKIVYP